MTDTSFSVHPQHPPRVLPPQRECLWLLPSFPGGPGLGHVVPFGCWGGGSMYGCMWVPTGVPGTHGCPLCSPPPRKRDKGKVKPLPKQPKAKVQRRKEKRKVAPTQVGTWGVTRSPHPPAGFGVRSL